MSKGSSSSSYNRAVLCGLIADSLPDEQQSGEESIEELKDLLSAAGGTYCGTVLQHRKKADSRFFFGKGKLEDIRNVIVMEQCDLVVFDNNLTPSQTTNLSQELDIRVMDRSALILDIFADRARTKEGCLQVELAKYKYMLPRLTGMWTHLDRETASGGSSPIGTRGTGETQLESDKRYIRKRIDRLEKDLKTVRKNRSTQRNLRQKRDIPLVSLVGYTNAGKSTLMNCLTGADIPANNRLFDTLDPTTRRMYLPDGNTILLSDTVGFIRRLPHHLIEAFKATLEELSYADIILHVIDISDPEFETKAEITEKLIEEICPDNHNIIKIFNKADLLSQDIIDNLYLDRDGIIVSARSGLGINTLKDKLVYKTNR